MQPEKFNCQIVSGEQALQAFDVAKTINQDAFEPFCEMCRRNGFKRITGYYESDLNNPKNKAIWSYLIKVIPVPAFVAGDAIFVVINTCAWHAGYDEGLRGFKPSKFPENERQMYREGWNAGYKVYEFDRKKIEESMPKKVNIREKIKFELGGLADGTY